MRMLKEVQRSGLFHLEIKSRIQLENRFICNGLLMIAISTSSLVIGNEDASANRSCYGVAKAGHAIQSSNGEDSTIDGDKNACITLPLNTCMQIVNSSPSSLTSSGSAYGDFSRHRDNNNSRSRGRHEKCYGITKKGYGENQRAPGWRGIKDNDENAFIHVPRGVCAKLVNGTLTGGF